MASYQKRISDLRWTQKQRVIVTGVELAVWNFYAKADRRSVWLEPGNEEARKLTEGHRYGLIKVATKRVALHTPREETLHANEENRVQAGSADSSPVRTEA